MMKVEVKKGWDNYKWVHLPAFSIVSSTIVLEKLYHHAKSFEKIKPKCDCKILFSKIDVTLQCVHNRYVHLIAAT